MGDIDETEKTAEEVLQPVEEVLEEVIDDSNSDVSTEEEGDGDHSEELDRIAATVEAEAPAENGSTSAVEAPSPKPKEKVRVVLDRSKLKMSLVKQAERVIEVPEFNNLMGLKEGEVAVVKIRQLTLDQYILCQTDHEDRMRNLIQGVIVAAEKLGEVEDEILAMYRSLSPKAKYYLDLCSKGVIEPVGLKRPDWIFLAKMYPLTIERLAADIIILTKGGADLKKNS